MKKLYLINGIILQARFQIKFPFYFQMPAPGPTMNCPPGFMPGMDPGKIKQMLIYFYKEFIFMMMIIC